MHRSKLLERLALAKSDGWDQWILSEADERWVYEGGYFSEAAAQHTADFYPLYLRHSKGPYRGQPFILLEWQRDDVVAPLFGWMREDGFRRYRTAWIEVPKKQGKSTWLAGTLLYLHVADGEPGPETYIAATDQKQAMIIFREICAMVRVSPDLSKILRIRESQNIIVNRDSPECFIRPLSKTSEGAEGINAHARGMDEVHLWKDRRLWDILRYSGRARDQPLGISITTAGDDTTSLAYEEHEYGLKVIRGEIYNPTHFAYIRGADAEDDFTDPETHKKANPSYGITIRPEDMADEAREALQKPSARRNFLQRSLNIWGSPAESFFDMVQWERCNFQVKRRRRYCVGTFDMSSTRDTTAFSIIWPPEGNVASFEDPFQVLTYYWIPESRNTVEAEQEDGAPYRQWVQDGWIKATPGNRVDYEIVRRDILQLRELHGFERCGCDPSEATHMISLLGADGLDVIPLGQGAKYQNAPLKRLEDLIVDMSITFLGNPVTRWQASKAKAKRNAGDQIFLIKRMSRGRIDGPVTIVMGLGLLMVDFADVEADPGDGNPGVYFEEDDVA